MSIEFSIEKIPTADISVSAEWVQPLIEAFFEIEPDSGMALVAKLTNKELSVLRSALKKNAPHGFALQLKRGQSDSTKCICHTIMWWKSGIST